MVSKAFCPFFMGKSALDVLVTASLPLSRTSQAQPLPNTVVAAFVSSVTSLSCEPKSRVIAWASSPLGLAAAVGFHGRPVKGVIPDLGRVVEDAGLAGHDDVFERLRCLGLPFEELVQVGHIGRVVFAVVELERLRAEVGGQGGLLVGERRKRDHGQRVDASCVPPLTARDSCAAR